LSLLGLFFFAPASLPSSRIVADSRCHLLPLIVSRCAFETKGCLDKSSITAGGVPPITAADPSGL
jgi:hypothetical protein